MSSLRLIGPALGYALASVCIKMYVNLSEETTLKPTDPSWIGAWWLGKTTIRNAFSANFNSMGDRQRGVK